MEHSYRPETPLSSTDNSSSESLNHQLTRLNSTASSLTAESFKLRRANASSNKCTGWTNEKHNAFLDDLEASFVKQLHRSIILHAGSVELNRTCRSVSEKRSSSSGVKTRSHLILSNPAELRRLTEGSGQNFAGEYSEENPSCKKMKKTLAADKEQIVPTWNCGSSGVDSK